MIKHAFAVLLLAITSAGSAAASGDQGSSATATGSGARVPQFTAQALDVSGEQPKTAEFDSQKTERITAYIFIATRCAATGMYQERFMRLAQTYAPKGVDFVYIYPNRNDSPEQERAFHKEKNLGGRLIDDRGGRLAKLFKAEKTTEVFLADKQGVIVYHGAVDDSRNDDTAVQKRYVATAFDELLAGKPVTITVSPVDA